MSTVLLSSPTGRHEAYKKRLIELNLNFMRYFWFDDLKFDLKGIQCGLKHVLFDVKVVYTTNFSKALPQRLREVSSIYHLC